MVICQIVPALARDARIAARIRCDAAVRDTALLHALDIPTQTLEGYLFPDTYVFPTARRRARRCEMMVKRFEQVWEPAVDDRLQQLAMSRNDVMALAAIVEKEARLPEERPVIAAVYLNRLEPACCSRPIRRCSTRSAPSRRVFYKISKSNRRTTRTGTKGCRRADRVAGEGEHRGGALPRAVPYQFFVAFPDGHHEFRPTFRGCTPEAVQEAQARARAPVTMSGRVSRSSRTRSGRSVRASCRYTCWMPVRGASYLDVQEDANAPTSEPGTGISSVQSKGTSSQPSSRAACAGNSLVDRA